MSDISVLGFRKWTTFEEWVTAGQHLCQVEKKIHWLIGDWWRDGCHQYGDRAKLAAKDIWGLSFQTLADTAWVAGKFTTSRRREVLSFSHHKEVAALEPRHADRLLDMAEDEGWSVRQIRQQANKLKNAKAIEAPVENPTNAIESLDDLLDSGERFGTIYADPPWLYDNQGTRGATGNHYSGLTVEEICALPVADLVADDAHLHLWITNGFLFDAPRVFEAWGFEYRSSFVWVKPQMGLGNYWRNSHEFLLTAIRGDAKRFNDHSLLSWGQYDRLQHSAKPEQIRQFIERASPGPRLELFGRRKVDGWTVWGDQIERNLFHQAA